MQPILKSTFKHSVTNIQNKVPITLFLTNNYILRLCNLYAHQSSANAAFLVQPEILHYPLAQQHCEFFEFAKHMDLQAVKRQRSKYHFLATALFSFIVFLCSLMVIPYDL